MGWHEPAVRQLQTPAFSACIIAHAVWLYFLFPLSLRLVEEMLERGVVSYETVRRWATKFGREYARRLRRKRPSPCDIWHLDEVVVSIGGKKQLQRRAVETCDYPPRGMSREEAAGMVTAIEDKGS